MSEDSNHELSRRNVLGGLVTIGAASAAAGAGTMALFSDTESSTGNTIQAGTLDLQPNGSNVGSFSLSNKAPGDSGTQVINLSNAGSLDGHLAFTIRDVTNNENGVTDPENSANGEDGSGNPGELGKWLNLEMGFTDDGTNLGNDAVVEGYLTASDPPFPDNGGMNQVRFNQNTLLLAEGGTKDFVLNWSIPPEAGDAIQSDGVEMDIEFELMQEEASAQVVLGGTTTYANGDGWDGFNATNSAAHTGSGSWQAQSTNGQEGIWFAGEYSEFDQIGQFNFRDIQDIGYWMKHPNSLQTDYFLQVLTKPRNDASDFASWYNARYTAIPPNSNDGSPVWNPGEWNEFGTTSGDQNQLYFYLQDNQSVSVTPRPLSWLNNNSWTVGGHDYPNDGDEVLAVAIVTNSSQTGFTGYLDDIWLNTANHELSIDLEP